MNYRWTYFPDEADVSALAALSGAGVDDVVLRKCLWNRGCRTSQDVLEFLDPALKRLRDPFELMGMDDAVKRITKAVERSESIVVFGDFDVDGVASAAMLCRFFQWLKLRIEVYLPDRLEEGYGLSSEAVKTCYEKFHPQLLIAVDCGTTSVDEIAWMKQNGVDVIVVDHHQAKETSPPALALINPHAYPSDLSKGQEFCTAGLCFKLIHALVKRWRGDGVASAEELDVRELLEWVALATIADLAPLTGENRILVTSGLTRLSQTKQPGLQALKQIAKLSGTVGAYEVGFQLAPRLNAAGRMESARAAYDLLICDSVEEARRLASYLDLQNRERQEIEKSALETALELLAAQFESSKDYAIVLGDPHWHPGVLGIIASRISRKFYRLTIILGGGETQWRGSGRSVAGFDLADALKQCHDLLLKYGGHTMAAGVTMERSKVEPLRLRLSELAKRILGTEGLVPELRLDAEVKLKDLSQLLVERIEKLAPFGLGNPSVQLCTRGVTVNGAGHRFGKSCQHIRIPVTDGAAKGELIWWNAESDRLPVGKCDVVFTPELNVFQGRTSVRLKLLDWKPST